MFSVDSFLEIPAFSQLIQISSKELFSEVWLANMYRHNGLDKKQLLKYRFFDLDCSSCHFCITDNKLEYVLFDACIPAGFGNIERTKDDVIWFPSQ